LDFTGSNHPERLGWKQVYATLGHLHPGITIDRQRQPKVFSKDLPKVAHGIEASAELAFGPELTKRPSGTHKRTE
jgi:hypothetical protein